MNYTPYPHYSDLVRDVFLKGDRVLKKWQPRMGLDSWRIELYIDVETELWDLGGYSALLRTFPSQMYATITLDNPHNLDEALDSDNLYAYGLLDGSLEDGIEFCIIHELLHLWVMSVCDESNHCEDLIDHMALSLLKMDRQKNPLVADHRFTFKRYLV